MYCFIWKQNKKKIISTNYVDNFDPEVGMEKSRDGKEARFLLLGYLDSVWL